MTPSEADALAGLMIGVACSVEAVECVDYASEHRVAAPYLISLSQCGDIVGDPQVFGRSA
jgi:hypothetical protein